MTIPIAVQNGATLLDQVIPGWFEVINVERLDLNSPWACVLGQLSLHEELIPEKYLSSFHHRSRENFTKTLAVLERATGHEIGLYEFGFIEEATWGPFGGIDHLGNRRGWAEAIADRKALKVQREAERQRSLEETALAKQVRAGIDAELKAMLAEREYELVA